MKEKLAQREEHLDVCWGDIGSNLILLFYFFPNRRKNMAYNDEKEINEERRRHEQVRQNFENT